MTKVSVIIPVYNVEKYLTRCLQSVCGQTMKDIEIICVNDGSTDRSLQILQEYAQQDGRIKVINQENQGLSVARNVGIDNSVAEYISFIDSDDFIHHNFLEVLYNAIKKTNSDISGCNFQKITKQEGTLSIKSNIKAEISANPLKTLLHKKNYIHFNVWNKLYRRDIISNIRFPIGIYFEDWVFNTIVFDKATRFAWIDQPLYGYRISSDSIMRGSFNEKKLHDYVSGIKIVHAYFQNSEKWAIIKKTRISRTVKMMMNSALRSKNTNLFNQAKDELKKLYNQNLIGYQGLSLVNKIKLFNFLH